LISNSFKKENSRIGTKFSLRGLSEKRDSFINQVLSDVHISIEEKTEPLENSIYDLMKDILAE